jgi:hypothetical protein
MPEAFINTLLEKPSADAFAQSNSDHLLLNLFVNRAVWLLLVLLTFKC